VKWPAFPVPNVRLLQHYLPFSSLCAPRRLHPRLQSGGECRVEPKGKPRLALMMPMLILPQPPFTACHANPTTIAVSTTSCSDVIRVPLAPL
jgi:hypothetical protein